MSKKLAVTHVAPLQPFTRLASYYVMYFIFKTTLTILLITLIKPQIMMKDNIQLQSNIQCRCSTDEILQNNKFCHEMRYG